MQAGTDFQRRVLVVEDEPLLRGLISSKLTADGFIVATAASTAEARTVATEFDPDVAVLDIELGDGPTGVELAQVLLHEFPTLTVVFLTHIPEPRVVGISNKAIPKNAAYLVKERIADPGVLTAAIEAASRNKVSDKFRVHRNLEHSLQGLTARQLEVLRMIALGMSNGQIAAQRETSVRAVENLINRALKAAGIDTNSSCDTRVIGAREFIRIAGMPGNH